MSRRGRHTAGICAFVVFLTVAGGAYLLRDDAAEAAIPALTAAFDDEDDEVRRDAKKALAKVSVLREMHRPPPAPPADMPKLSPLILTDGWREALRAKWLAFLGEIPRDRGPLEAQVLETEEITKLTRRHVRYRIEDGVYTEGYLLTPWDLPADGSRKAPAVVVFHQTVDSHAKQPAGIDPQRPGLHIGVHLAERGYVAFCPRCYIFDEGADYAGNVAKMKARHPAWKGMTRMLFDAVRAADYLESLPYVDPKRIGCIGHSLGAKEVLYAAAFDERYRAAVSSEGGIGLGMSNWDAPWYLGPEIKAPGFEREHHELLALIAPRAFLLLAGGTDLGGADGARSWAFVEAGLAVYKLLGADDRFGWIDHGFGHDYPRAARAAAEEFLDRWLRG